MLKPVSLPCSAMNVWNNCTSVSQWNVVTYNEHKTRENKIWINHADEQDIIETSGENTDGVVQTLFHKNL